LFWEGSDLVSLSGIDLWGIWLNSRGVAIVLQSRLITIVQKRVTDGEEEHHHREEQYYQSIQKVGKPQRPGEPSKQITSPPLRYRIF
jgi:hypothetical protein